MGARKGEIRNPNGRPKGAKGKKNMEWEALGESIVTLHAERFNNILATAEDDVFLRHYVNVLEFFKPKLNRTTHEGEMVIQSKQVFEIGGKRFEF